MILKRFLFTDTETKLTKDINPGCLGPRLQPPLPNAENRSVYFGYGCFWHAQYDFYEIEHDVFDRSPSQVTSLVGYAGGLYTSEDGLVCYHGGPAGSEYGDDGHAEVVQVELDAGQEEAQYTQLLSKFFNDGFICDGSDCSRKDPGDRGAAYRNVLGLPGGKAGKLWHLVNPQNVHAMELRDGGDNGGRGDEEDEGLVYVYDSLQYHFYRGEQYHQFHANTVLGRACPSSYLVSLKNTQKALHRYESHRPLIFA